MSDYTPSARDLRKAISAMLRGIDHSDAPDEVHRVAQWLRERESTQRLLEMTEAQWARCPSVEVRKAWVGWWVDGRWCPTRKILDHEIVAARKRNPKTYIR